MNCLVKKPDGDTMTVTIESLEVRRDNGAVGPEWPAKPVGSSDWSTVATLLSAFSPPLRSQAAGAVSQTDSSSPYFTSRRLAVARARKCGLIMFAVYVFSIIAMIVVGQVDYNNDRQRRISEAVFGVFGYMFMGSWICVTITGPVLAMKKKRPGIAFLSFLFTPIGFLFALGAEDRSSPPVGGQP